MNDFHYRDNQLWCENVPVRKIAEQIGTPFYLYSHQTLKNHFAVFDQAFADVPHLVCYSVKANSNIAVLRLFIQEGAGVDVVSGGELYRAIKAGVDPQKVVYSGVGKRWDEIEYALSSNILMFNCESPQELQTINEYAQRAGKKAGIGLRINPDVDPKTNSHISTGLKEDKFGIPFDQAAKEYLQAKALPNLDIKGISCHIGSQITSLAPFLDALSHLKKLIIQLREHGIKIRYLDLGGGLGIHYSKENPPQPAEYAKAVIDASGDLGCTYILEPGRVLVGNAGIMVAKVLYTKSHKEKNFVIVDAGMNDLIRPGFYGAYHHVQPVIKKNAEFVKVDVVGPICESSDYFAKGRHMERVQSGDLVAVMSAGAYGFCMASNYNSRPRAPEIMVKGKRFYIIRKREGYADLVRGEKTPFFLKTKQK
ncbi:MAG: diaminopimelate decarboxylase [Deltaproteobacteria bacterium]|nr:diaminopimelate decarboxylase [Deltaproteobacteria bacterium]